MYLQTQLEASFSGVFVSFVMQENLDAAVGTLGNKVAVSAEPRCVENKQAGHEVRSRFLPVQGSFSGKSSSFSAFV